MKQVASTGVKVMCLKSLWIGCTEKKSALTSSYERDPNLKISIRLIKEMKGKMKFIRMFLKLIGSAINTAVILAICSSIMFVAYKGNQPMQVSQAPKGMTYFEFIAVRIDAAKTVEPSRCGWGMMLSLAVLGPVYSFVYTEVGIHPDGFLARGTASDPDIPKDVAGVKWYDIPGIWWKTVERLSWTMLGKPAAHGCKFRAVIQ